MGLMADDDQYISETEGKEVELFPEVVELITMFNCSDKVAATIANQKKYNYMQAFQTICAINDIDAMLMFAITAVETEGYPECANRLGMFQLAGNSDESNMKHQLSYAIQRLKNKIEIFGENNMLGALTSYKLNDPALDEYLLDASKRPEVIRLYPETLVDAESGETTTNVTARPYGWQSTLEYGEDYCVLLDYFNYDLEAMAYYGKVCMCYNAAVSSITGQSTLDQSYDGMQYAFPFVSGDLSNIYFISDFGVESTDFGVAKLKAQILFKCKPGTAIHAPHSCFNVQMSKTSNGFTISIPSDNNGTLYYLLIDKTTSSSNYFESFVKNQIIGYTGNYFAIAYKDSSGAIQDPKLIFSQLNGKLSKEKSIGDQLIGSTVIWTHGNKYIIG